MSSCLKCGSKTEVKDSRQTPTTDLRRRRVCLNKECGYRYTTLEIPTSTHPRSKEIADWASQEVRRILMHEEKEKQHGN